MRKIRVYLFIFISWSLFNIGLYADGERIKVACIGDSITAGYLLKNSSTESYPAQLQILLGEKHEVRNFGNSGRGIYRHSMRGKEKRAYIFMPEHKAALLWEPDIVICNLGINDCGEYLKRDLKSTPETSQFVLDYLALLSDYQKLPKPPTFLIWTKLAPLGKGQKFQKSPEPFLMQRDLEYVAQQTNAIELNMETPLLSLIDEHFPDKLHPDAFAAKKIAEKTAQKLKPFLEKQIKFTLPWWLSDNAILPADKVIKIKGTAIPGSIIETPFGKTITASNGIWSINTYPIPATWSPCNWIFSINGEKIIIKNILFGDVWVCAGQSNMAMTLGECKESLPKSSKKIRLLPYICQLPTSASAWTLEIITKSKESPTFSGTWQIVSEKNADNFSALGVMLANGFLQKKPERPIGIIQIAVGGAPVEAFLPAWMLAKYPELLSELTPRDDYSLAKAFESEWPKHRLNKNLSNVSRKDRMALLHPFAPMAIWEGGMLNQLNDFSATGILWYQGESNASHALSTQDRATTFEYAKSSVNAAADFMAFIGGEQVMVELVGKINRPWKTFRKAQNHVAKERCIKIIKTNDLGDQNNVHPRDKAPIIKRFFELKELKKD